MVERHPVDLRAHEARVEEGADLRGERDAPAVAPPVEGLDAELVASGDEPSLAGVPEREGEDAVQLAHAIGAVLLVGVHDDLAVGAGREAVAAGLELFAQLAVVVDLAVDDRRDRAVLGVERLVAAGHVDDRQARVGERERAEPSDALAVGPAVAQRLDHPLRGLGRRGPAGVEDRSYSTHAR